jgi:hypothetical protein
MVRVNNSFDTGLILNTISKIEMIIALSQDFNAYA